MKTKKRNAQDLTLRNLRPLKERVETLESWAKSISVWGECVTHVLNTIIQRRNVLDPNPGKQEKNMAKKKAVKKPVKSGKKGC